MLPLWVGGGGLPKKKSPPTYIEILNGPPHFCSFHSQHALVSIVGLFYPLIKPKHGPLIFKYPKALPNKITLYLLKKKKKKNQKNKKKQKKNTLSPILNLKIGILSLLFFLFSSSLLCTRHCSLVPVAPKQNKSLSSAFLSGLVLTTQKKENLTIIFFLLAFLK